MAKYQTPEKAGRDLGNNFGNTAETQCSTLDKPSNFNSFSRRNRKFTPMSSRYEYNPRLTPEPFKSKKTISVRKSSRAKGTMQRASTQLEGLFNTTCKLTEGKLFKPIDPERKLPKDCSVPDEYEEVMQYLKKSIQESRPSSIFRIRRSITPSKSDTRRKHKDRQL